MSDGGFRRPDAHAEMTPWDAGAYERIAERLEPIARELVESAEVGAGQRVVDVAAGTGNVALAAAVAGATVAAVDLAPRLVATGRTRTSGHPVTWHVSDASALPLPDVSAEVVLSNFGMIFVPDREALIGELSRVLVPGGRLAFTAWVPGRAADRLHDVLRRHLPSQAGRPEASDWARPDLVTRLLTPAFGAIRTTVQPFAWTFGSVAEATALFLDASPLHLAALAAADDEAAVRAEFTEELARMASKSGTLHIDSPFAIVSAQRR